MTNTDPYTAPQSSAAAEQEEFYTPEVFTFSGRIGRLRYLAYGAIWSLIFFGAILAGGAIMGLLSLVGGITTGVGIIGMVIFGLIFVVAYIAFLVVTVSVMVRRFNDMNMSGWWTLLIIVPLVNLIPAIMLLFVPGTKATNRFGPQPCANSTGVIVYAAVVLPLTIIFTIGILAAVAVPAYQDYVLRSQGFDSEDWGTTDEDWSSFLDEVEGEYTDLDIYVPPVQYAILEYIETHGDLPSQNSDIEFEQPVDSETLQSIELSEGGVITVTYRPSLDEYSEKTIVYVPVTDEEYYYWDCTRGTLANELRPFDCQAYDAEYDEESVLGWEEETEEVVEEAQAAE